MKRIISILMLASLCLSCGQNDTSSSNRGSSPVAGTEESGADFSKEHLDRAIQAIESLSTPVSNVITEVHQIDFDALLASRPELDKTRIKSKINVYIGQLTSLRVIGNALRAELSHFRAAKDKHPAVQKYANLAIQDLEIAYMHYLDQIRFSICNYLPVVDKVALEEARTSMKAIEKHLLAI